MRLVVALGGNALGNTPSEQREIVKNTAKALIEMIEMGNDLVITHGNGPQVGMINVAFDEASAANSQVPPMEFPECGAMSQGYIGFHLQNALKNELIAHNIDKPVVTLITQVVVNENDKAFNNPTKPVGGYYDKKTADRLAKEKGFIMTMIPNRGYRRVVPSPEPIDIVEAPTVEKLVNDGGVVITVGGGGIPVVKRGKGYYGVPAVIDKDFASAKVAELVDADKLIILTEVDKVAVNFNTPEQRDLDVLTVSEAKKYIKEDQFGKGSMLPKVQAAISFVEHSIGKEAIIASLSNVAKALMGESGTIITK